MRAHIPIWFFAGVLFLIYGIVITITGIYELAHPPSPLPALNELHPAIWWGAFMGVAGLWYTIHFRPRAGK